jgi:membrane-bound metal-dependent hydrolase YbcI (DUF457 family)
MLGRTHAITGLAAGLAFAAITHTTATTPIAAYALAAGAALLPDLDQHAAMATRTIATKPAHVILRHFQHRCFTHSILGVSIFAAFVFVAWASLALFVGNLSPAFATLTVAGYISHLVADAFNKQGIMLFYPYSPFKIKWWSIPLPRSMRISTIHETKGRPLSAKAIQSRIHTEKWFFTYPVYIIIGWLAWHGLSDLALAAHHDVMSVIASSPAPVASLLSGLLQ